MQTPYKKMLYKCKWGLHKKHKEQTIMNIETCTICGFGLTSAFCCPACDAADAIVEAGGCHPNFKEALAEKIGNLLADNDWHTTINVHKMYPRFF
jgi:hypothetical protein